MLAEKQRLETQIKDLRERINKLPEGKLLSARNGKYCKWYQTDGKHQKYIPKKERYLAEKLAAKKYLVCRKEELEHELEAIHAYLNFDKPKEHKSELLLQNPQYKELLSKAFQPTSMELLEWMNSPFNKNTSHPEQLKFKTHEGDYVRSKSEVIIDMFLRINHIPFRYECALELGEITLFPDFTVRHPHTGKLYYWEHFGLMDNPNYYHTVFSKLELYTSYGIIPSIQLITTFETKEHPLSPETVEKIIEHYFL